MTISLIIIRAYTTMPACRQAGRKYSGSSTAFGEGGINFLRGKTAFCVVLERFSM